MDALGFATDTDQAALQQHGLSADETRRQWELLMDPPQVVLDRACTIGDGIEQLAASDHDGLIAAHHQSAAQGRWIKFVPASGAASRMFALRSDDDQRQFVQSLERFAFFDELRAELARRQLDLHTLAESGRYEEVLDALVAADGLGYGALPKGLIPFHGYPEGTRTPFEEHLRESQACLRDEAGNVAVHSTVTPEHRERFADHLQQIVPRLASGSYQVGFSVQDPATDTIALDASGHLLRAEDGKPVLRPGGHGALLKNVNALGGDLLFVKNIDNVAHEQSRGASVYWMQILGGYLVRLQAAVHQHVRSLQTNEARAVAAARDFVLLTFPGATLPAAGDSARLRQVLLSCLQRPLRVCGMVPNEGEPGGGPFWVRRPDGGTTLQIVETAEVDTDDARQQAAIQQSTHFNPVFMVLAARDEGGEPFDLARFADERRVIVTRKPVGGQDARVLERPGLWNGAMAHWNSVFVEVPKDVFSPVKTVLDLLRPAHQPVSDTELTRQ